ncbi:hypothetical protein [Microvirga alba]|uniref:Uncharacterized protein n=1 Tax=Microvirga alba TaxID=2791025 RepID=A0A931BUG8_9HYPH|nr:hypothetical protein [Microvirga alba]MBF9234959.1 hypothetical protein [Microvirga alba]
MATRKEHVAAVIMGLCAVAALSAFVSAIPAVGTAAASGKIVEAWRCLGFFLFAGLFALLAIYPRRLPGLWELVFLHKAGMAIFAVSILGTAALDAPVTAIADGILALLTLVSYVLARGYEAWRFKA